VEDKLLYKDLNFGFLTVFIESLFLNHKGYFQIKANVQNLLTKKVK